MLKKVTTNNVWMNITRFYLGRICVWQRSECNIIWSTGYSVLGLVTFWYSTDKNLPRFQVSKSVPRIVENK